MLPLRWTSAPPIHPASRPLRRPGSLTARLARSGTISIDVLASGWQRARSDEAQLLGLARSGQRIYARLVCVRRAGQAAVLARSITTIAGSRGAWKGLRRLGRRPLATLLWGSPEIRRGPFEYARLGCDDPLLRAIGCPSALPARRSTFWHAGQALIVQEAFVGLPWPAVPWQAPRRRWRASH
jgi:chorismate lyase